MKEINIFIHGLGSSKAVWDTLINNLSEKSQDKYSKKLKEYIGNMPLDENSIYYTHMEYDSGFLSSKFPFLELIRHYYGAKDKINNLSIQDLVKQFCTEMNTILDKFQIINIYAHSLGGVIALQYFLDYKPDTQKINTIFYFASPFSGSPNSDKLVQYSYATIFKILKLKPTKILSQLRTNSDYINGLNDHIEQNREYLRKIDTHFFLGQNDGRIEDPTNLLELFIQDTEKIHILNFDHSSIVQIDNRDLHRFPLICGSIFGKENLPPSTHILPNENHINMFETYFKKCPPNNIPDTYIKKININKLLKRHTNEDTTKAYNRAVDIFNNTFRICFDLHLTEVPKKITKSDDILFSLNENPNFDNLFDIEKVNHLFISEYYRYPKLAVRNFSSDDANIISQSDSYKSFKARVLNHQMLFLEGNIGEGKSTILNKLYIDFLDEKDWLDSIIIPIYCIVNDYETNEDFLYKINQSMLNSLKTSKHYVDFTHQEFQEHTVNTSLGKKRIDKISHSLEKSKIPIKDFSTLVIGKDIDTIEKITDDDLYTISKQLIKKDIQYVLIVDNLDSFSYTDERYMFLENAGFEKFNSGVDYVKNIITKLLEYNTKGKISIISALRPYVLTHLSTNNNIGNMPKDGISHTVIYKIVPDTKIYANESIRTRMNLLYDLLNILSKRRLYDQEISNQLKAIIADYSTMYKSLDNTYRGHQRITSPESIMEKFYNISTQGYRTIISFFNDLPNHPSLLKNYLSNSDILLLYKLGLYQKYTQILPHKVNGHQPANLKIKHGESGKKFNFPNLFLVVSNTICNIEYENACRPNTITYWLKYIILNYINNNSYSSMEQVLMTLSGDTYEENEGFYEPHLVKLSVGSLGTVNEYNCLEYDFHDVSMETVDELILNTKIKLTTRGKTLIKNDELFDISTLQFLVEDWLLPSPKLEKILNSDNEVSISLKKELNRLMECKINYEYLTDTNKYSRVLRLFILDKAKLSIWFLTLLEYSLKYEKILYKKAFRNLSFMDSLDKNFFDNQKERIISRVTDHILKNYYIKNNMHDNDQIELNNFFNLCNHNINIDNIDKYFETVYSKKVLFICNT